VKFMLDEDVDSPRIHRIAETLGLDVTGVSSYGRQGLADEEQLSFAASNDRCLVTRNFRDFTLLTRHFETVRLPHAGVLYVPRRIGNSDFLAIGQALLRFSDAHPEGVPPYYEDWLR
jgi:hypothetical protein